MRNPEVNWAEGMFLRPQHLQVASRQFSGLVADTFRSVQPFSWGFVDVEIAEDQLEGFTFALRRCDVVFKDGTRGCSPTNLVVDQREFKDKLDESDGSLEVYLGVPVLREGERNSQPLGSEDVGADLRYAVDIVEVSDENLGGPLQQIEVRKLRARFFLGDENREGYECVPIALIRRAGFGSNAPTLAEEFIPPVVNVTAWPSLKKLGEAILHRVEAKHRFLRAEVSEGRVNLDVAGGEGWQPVLKLQIVGAFLHMLRQLVGSAGVHPFLLYVELARLAGELSIFDEEGAENISVPTYDHDKLGECFATAAYTIERLLEKILSGRFVRVPFVLTEDILIAKLKEEWLAPSTELYLCVESDLADRMILTRIETAKIGASADLPLLKQRRLFGLDIELLNRTPGGLPSRENFHYFAIQKEGMYWDSVVRNHEVAISGAIDPQLGFSLFIILQPERG